MSLNFFRKFYNWYLLFLILIVSLPIIAPLLLKLSETLTFLSGFANLIYLIYSFTCHQFAYRSLYLFDYQFAWCARDTGIWLGMLLGAIFVRYYKPLKWYWIIPFVIPIALDGGIQTIATLVGVQPSGPVGSPLYISGNVIRFMSGAIFGIGLSMLISPVLYYEAGAEGAEERKTMIAKNKKYFFLSLIGICFVAYFGFVQVWNLTSNKVKPSDLLDSAVKFPANDFYERRKDAPCPAGIEDLVRWECLVGR